jgi:pimeloyl-ACP methyl ester carboxylesterase
VSETVLWKNIFCSQWWRPVLLEFLAAAAIGAAIVSEFAPLPSAELERSTLSWTTCPFNAGPRVRCGKLDVPENWRAPKGQRIRIAFAYIAAAKTSSGNAPMMFLTGGPGVSAFAAVGSLEQLPSLADRDVIAVEPRGYGYAEPALVCPDRFEKLAECQAHFKRKGVDVEQYNVTNAAHDLEALRRALRITRYDVLGVSFGTNRALLQARLYPQPIRAMILDSPYPPQANYGYNRASALNAFGYVADTCRAEPACNTAFPDLRQRFIDALRRAEAAPETVDGVTLDGGTLFAKIYHQLYETPTLANTPRLIDLAARGKYAELLKALGAGYPTTPGFDPARAFASGLNASVECADDIPFADGPDTRVAFRAPWPDDIVKMIRPEGWNYDRICRDWPVRTSVPAVAEPVSTSIPALIMVGRFDPATPPEFAEAMALRMPNSTILVNRSASHAVVTSGHACVYGAIDAFLAAPMATLDLSCTETIPDVAWTER